MPQLDFFTVKAQLVCLLVSLFLIYCLLLKYAMPAYDILLRLKMKKIAYYRLGVENLVYLSLIFKNSSQKYVDRISFGIFNFSKVYFNFLAITFPMLYSMKIINKKIIKTEIDKPLVVATSNLVRFPVKEIHNLQRIKFSTSNFNKFLKS